MKGIEYQSMYTHSWVSGMMVVHPEDIAAGYHDGNMHLECELCEAAFPTVGPCREASPEVLAEHGFRLSETGWAWES